LPACLHPIHPANPSQLGAIAQSSQFQDSTLKKKRNKKQQQQQKLSSLY
jgi:hypothetical protein